MGRKRPLTVHDSHSGYIFGGLYFSYVNLPPFHSLQLFRRARED